MAAYNIGRDFGAGMKAHAVPADADAASGFSRNTRFEGYRVPYKALCGLEVWQPVNRDDYKPLPWAVSPGSFGSCKSCERQIEKRAAEVGAAPQEERA